MRNYLNICSTKALNTILKIHINGKDKITTDQESWKESNERQL